MKFKKKIAWFLIFINLAEISLPTITYGLTGGPQQPEFSGFASIEQTEMVNLFTGDFNYNIPLLSVGDYPVNLSYQAGITMDQEASWVGLGWTLNPGVINRNVRGVPDDFKGDVISQEFNTKPNITYGVNMGVNVEIFGNDKTKKKKAKGGLGASIGVVRNNYKGLGINFGINSNVSGGIAGKGNLTGSLGLNFGTFDGTSFSAAAGIQKSKNNEETTSGFKIGSAINSRGGLQELTFSVTSSKLKDAKGNKIDDTGLQRSGSLSFAGPCVTPTIDMPLHNFGYSMSVSGGVALFGITGMGSVSGFYSEQSLQENYKMSRSYGYLNEQSPECDDNSLVDMQREKDVPFVKSAKNIAVPIHAFDLYSVSGQGINGQFRAFRGDAGILYDKKVNNPSGSAAGSLEVGATPNLLHFGASITGTICNTETQRWNESNFQQNVTGFRGEEVPLNEYEPVYFKMTGESFVEDAAYYDNIRQSDLIRVPVNKDGAAFNSFKRYDAYKNQKHEGTAQEIKRTIRVPRSTYINALNAIQASYAGVETYIGDYPNYPNFTPDDYFNGRIARITANNSAQYRKSRLVYPNHHTSEISVTNESGQMFVYGIPAYNNSKVECTFATDKTVASTGLVTYTPGEENWIRNSAGRDNYLNRTATSPYAYAYLLTSILSPDYQDITGDGVTDDDNGSFTKFNYSNKVKNYRWRVPIEENSANFNEGLKSDPNDNKASYIYGTKDLWYLHSIENKNQVALFYISPRKDAHGVLNENGKVDPDSLRSSYKLDSIRLFNKSDLYQNANAVPLVSVYFDYNYSLCKQVPNTIAPNTIGKLTLIRISFRYGNSRALLNKYNFDYGEFAMQNPEYNMKRYDRWGNYRDDYSGYPNNADFPYVIQDQTKQDIWSSVWCLRKITLPSGGVFEIKYESKDYAYVQDKRAMQMMKIKCLADAPDITKSAANLFTGNTLNNYIFINVSDTVSNKESVKRKYLDGIDQMYYKFMVNVDNNNHFEYVSGYAEVADFGRLNDNTIYVKLKPSELTSTLSFNPISRAAWQLLRMSLPDYAYPSPSNATGFSECIESLVAPFSEILTLIRGYERIARDREYGRTVRLSECFVRLLDSDYKKLGGGCRVRQIAFSDNWSSMSSGEPGRTYLTNYDYTTEILVNNEKCKISSGVATYEPLIGGEEIPLRKPLKYDNNTILGPSAEMYAELPFGETMFPSPSIGYSKVTVSTEYLSTITRTRSGKEVHEFYTAKDFPVIADYTKLDPRIKSPKTIIKLLKLKALESQTLSQGFLVEVNNMHGKVKANTTYNELGSEIESEHFYYRSENYGSKGARLKNDVRLCNEKGEVVNGVMGREVDVWNDMRMQSTDNITVGAAFNTEGFIVPWGAMALGVILPQFGIEQTRFKSVASVKYINACGILDSTVKTVNGASVTSRNLIYDKYTGTPVLTSTINEFRDTILNYQLPAHYYYRQMGPAYQNAHLLINSAKINNGVFNNTTAMSKLHDGDIIIPCDNRAFQQYYSTNYTSVSPSYPYGKFQYWVYDNGNAVRIINARGQSVNATEDGNYYVIRSGRNNKLNDKILNKEVLDKTTKSSLAITNLNELDVASDYPTLQMSASTYNDTWLLSDRNESVIKCTATPFEAGFLDSLLKAIAIHDTDSLNNGHCFLRRPIESLGQLFAQTNVSTVEPDLNGVLLDSIWISNINFNTHFRNYDFIFSNGCSFTIELLASGVKNFNLCDIYKYTIDNIEGCRYLISSDHQPYAKVCMKCINCKMECRELNYPVTVNPFIHNIKNFWKNKATYDLLTDRTFHSGTGSVIQRYGAFNSTIKGWFNTSGTFSNDFNTSSWIKTITNSRIDNNGNSLETLDALNNYSAKLYRYNNQLVNAVAANAEYREIAFDDFEDYSLDNLLLNPCPVFHYSFRTALPSTDWSVSSEHAHSGKNSLHISGTGIYNRVKLSNRNSIETSVELVGNDVKMSSGNRYLEQLELEQNKEYIVECWVFDKENAACDYTSSINAKIQIRNDAVNPSTIEFLPEKYSIDGWRKISGRFTTTSLSELYIYLGSDGNIFYDDFRIYPAKAIMKSYVYDNRTFKLMSELDENNYSTYYEYDSQGNLVRLKKETPKGIMTIKEGYKSTVN